MRYIEYDEVADSVYFRFKGDAIAESVETGEGIVVDYDSQGAICGVEVLAFSKRNLDLNLLVILHDEQLVAELNKEVCYEVE